MRTIRFIILLFTLIASPVFSQRGHGHGHNGHGHGHRHHHGKKVVVKRSVYRPHKIVVYHPVWHPKYAYNRRWVYFPRYNMYWDNWRNHYVFWNGTIWFSQPAPPPVIVNVDLSKEKNYELKEKDDDEDDVYKGNEEHKTEFKSE